VQATLTSESLRQHLRSCIQTARERSDEIFSLLQPQALFERPIAERHRLIFYLGHLEAFEWNLICDRAFGMKSPNPELDRLFAFGIDPTNGNLPHDTVFDWPAESVIRNYNRNVRSAVDRCLERAAEDRTFWMAVEHRLMHVETLAYLVHGLPHWMKKVHAGPVTTAMEAPVPSQVMIPAGIATLGLERSSETFGWDNEYDAHEVHVPSFAMDVYNVSNSEYLEFVHAGGYDERSFWSASSWEWIKSAGIRHPKFWIPNGTGWRTRSMFADIPFQSTWPVYVSHAEAEAYCKWKGQALPTEAQYHRAAFGTPGGSQRPYPWVG
jgi:formylglycine-generating enzyme required for sulfatase activity